MKHYSQRSFLDVEQNSEEWFALRVGRITSSKFDIICANMGKAFGKPAIRYAWRLAMERVTGVRDETNVSTWAMDRGSMLEPFARERYELETFYSVTNGGFSVYKTYGDSTDGMVGSDGCIEIKSVIPTTQGENIERGKPDPAYKWQRHGHLYVSGREWCDHISYCPEFPENAQIVIQRVERESEMLEQLEERLEKFELLVEEKVELIKNFRNN